MPGAMSDPVAARVLEVEAVAAGGPPWIGAAHRRAAVDRQWLIAAAVMLASATTLFGWRALLHVLVAVMASTAMHLVLVILLRRRRRSEGLGHMSIWLGMMTGLSLPLTQDHTLPLLAGAATGALLHVVGRSHPLRVHPLAVTMLALWLAPQALLPAEDAWVGRSAMEPIDAVLRPSHLGVGDVFELVGGTSYEPWWRSGSAQLPAGIRRESFDDSLWRHRHEVLTQRSWLVSMLSSGELPRFEEMMIGAVPGPVGATSPALLILLGIWLMYRRLSWWPLPLLALLGALVTLALMPVPGEGAQLGQSPGVTAGWGTVARHLGALGPAAAVTLAAYLVLASPLPLIVMIHAPLTMPLTARGRAVYALILGSLTMAAMWLLATPMAAYLGLVVAGLLSRMLDNLHAGPFAR